MEDKYVLHNVAAQSTLFKTFQSKSKDTGIFLPPDLVDFIERNDEISFILYKQDFINALLNIIRSYPLYTSRAGNSVLEKDYFNFYNEQIKIINQFFDNNETAVYGNFRLSQTTGNRTYLYKLEVNGFSIRNFFISDNTTLTFIKTDNSLILRVETFTCSANIGRIEQDNSLNELSMAPLQQILFGAPGTGKSHTINSDANITEKNSIRTTFHPDSDYSTFVGCYKPTKDEERGEITYDFTPQAFTNAYIAAWKDLDNPFFLIIEEINRGNCAQIFGDIFQLLDRDEYGYSSYKTTPDQDLANYISKQFEDTDIDDAELKSGKKMQLPPNLYIWATMNTSDQSLFPIDSAFKRRWDWRYIPIDYTDRGHYIACGDTQYSWADFLQKVNERVESVTMSEDKKLGYWFMGNGAEQKEITIDRFVSKVVFYLWNDVFKDFGKSGNTIFKDSFAKFHLFFDFSGKPKVDVVKAFLNALGIKETTVTNEEYDDSDSEESNSKGSPFTYKLDGVFIEGIGQVVRKTIEKLCQTMNFEDILNDFNSIVNKTYQNESAMRLGTAQELGKDANGRNRWWKDPFTSKDGKIFSVIALWPDSDFERLKKFVEHYPSIFPGGLVQEVVKQ